MACPAKIHQDRPFFRRRHHRPQRSGTGKAGWVVNSIKNLLDDLGISYRLSSFDVPSEVIPDLARGKLCKQFA